MNKKRESIGSHWGVSFPLTQNCLWVHLALAVLMILKRYLQLSLKMLGQITWLFN